MFAVVTVITELIVTVRVGAKYFEKDLSKFQVQSQCTCT